MSIALCVPAYKAEAYLPRLLESAAIQNPKFDEIIVCVDASPDNSAAVAEKLGARVIVNAVNQGCSASKNNAFKASNCDWVHFHDADDILLPNFTALANKWVQSGNCPDVVLFDYEYRDNETNELIIRKRFNGLELRQDPVRYSILNQINPFCGLYRRSKLIEVDGYDTEPSILYNEDVAFHCKLATRGLSFDAENELSIINYRIGASMSQSNQLKCSRAQFEVMRRVAEEVGNRYGKEISTRLWEIASHLYMYNDITTGSQAIDLAMKLFPEVAVGQGRLFATVAKLIGPKGAFGLREVAIRYFKPHLRESNVS